MGLQHTRTGGPQCAPNFRDALRQTVISDGNIAPDGRQQSVTRHDPAGMDQKMREHRSCFGSQRYLTRVDRENSAREIEGEAIEGKERSLLIGYCHHTQALVQTRPRPEYSSAKTACIATGLAGGRWSKLKKVALCVETPRAWDWRCEASRLRRHRPSPCATAPKQRLDTSSQQQSCSSRRSKYAPPGSVTRLERQNRAPVPPGPERTICHRPERAVTGRSVTPPNLWIESVR